MIAVIICSILAVLIAGWVLYTNSNDRKTFEKELQEELTNDTDDYVA